MIDNAEAVIFTLKASKNGAWDAVLTSFSQEVFKPSLIALILGILSTAIAVLLSKRNFFYATRTFSQRLFWVNLFLGCGWIYFAVVSVPVLGDSALNIYKTYTKKKILVRSALYEKYYASANTARIHFDVPPRNLIYIMLESMGTEHISSLPELKEIQLDNLSFYPGGESIATQGWTIGSQIAKYCGVPLKFPAYDSIHVFLPNATCIQDLLDSFGYRQLYIQGTDKNFLSFGHFLETHSNIEMHDFTYYLENKRIDQRTSPWGIDDYTLFELLKQDLEKLSREDSPFALYAMTMDTHWPMGHISEECEIGKNDLNDKSGTYKRALLCCSKYVKSFLTWAQKQTWFENTLIVIQGDHMIPSNIRELLAMPKTDSNFWYNAFINAPTVDNTERKFSGFDMFPTILEMMGANIEGHKLNLGTSLLSNEPTLLEKLGNRRLDSLLNLHDEMDLFFMGVNR